MPASGPRRISQSPAPILLFIGHRSGAFPLVIHRLRWIVTRAGHASFRGQHLKMPGCHEHWSDGMPELRFGARFLTQQNIPDSPMPSSTWAGKRQAATPSGPSRYGSRCRSIRLWAVFSRSRIASPAQAASRCSLVPLLRQTAAGDRRLVVVFFLVRTRRQLDLVVIDLLVGNLEQDVGDSVQPRASCHTRMDDVPGRVLGVGILEHHVACAVVVACPAPVRFDVHRAQLPLADRIVDARFEALVLLLLADLQPDT